MEGFGVLAVIVYLAIIVFVITLLIRFVNAVEEIADAPGVTQQMLDDGRLLRRLGVEILCRGGPLEWQMSDGPRLPGSSQGLKGGAQDLSLAGAVAWRAELVTQRMLDPCQPRYAHRGGQVRDAG